MPDLFSDLDVKSEEIRSSLSLPRQQRIFSELLTRTSEVKKMEQDIDKDYLDLHPKPESTGIAYVIPEEEVQDGGFQDTYEDPLASQRRQLSLYLAVLGKVDKVGFQLTSEEMFDLISDLSSLVKYSSENLRLNDEVFEHPADISDVKGNVLMIHRKSHRYEKILNEHLADCLANIAHEYWEIARKLDSQAVLDSSLSQELGDYDLVESEDHMKLVARLIRLRKENDSTDRRNHFLSSLVLALKERVRKLKDKNLRALSVIRNHSFSTMVQSPSKVGSERSSNQRPFTQVMERMVSSKSVMKSDLNTSRSKPLKQTEFNFGDEKENG